MKLKTKNGWLLRKVALAMQKQGLKVTKELRTYLTDTEKKTKKKMRSLCSFSGAVFTCFQ